jgi:hypothetical protein
MRRLKFTQERERQLLDPVESPVNRANAIACMQSDEVVQHEELIVSFLDHKSPYLRAAAMKILLTWGRFEYVAMALDWLERDPDELVRGEMPNALSYVAHVGHRFEEIARGIVAAIERDPDVDVARSIEKRSGVRCPRTNDQRRRLRSPRWSAF